MSRPHSRALAVPVPLGAALVVAVLAFLLFQSGLVGQDAARPAPEAGAGKWMNGNFGVQFRLAARGENVERVVEILGVTRIVLGQDWVTLTVQEDEELVSHRQIPRENLLFLKYWSLEEPAGR